MSPDDEDIASSLVNNNAEQIGSALGFEGAVTKTGYLVKRQKSGGKNWKRRYFVLNGSSLVYYETHKRMDVAKGDLLLTVDCLVHDVQDSKYPFCFELVSAFETLRISASSDAESDEWKHAISEAISLLGSRTRGFLDVKVKSTFGSARWTRKFFVLHSSAMTYHHDHKTTYKKQGEFKLGAATRVRKMMPLAVELQTGDKKLRLQARNHEELVLWFAGISEAVEKLASRDDLAAKRGQENDESVLLDGYLATQPNPVVLTTARTRLLLSQNKSGVCVDTTEEEKKWPPRFYALTNTALYQAHHEYSTEAGNVFLLDPTSSVYMTRLREGAFELVTSSHGGVLHLQGATPAETRKWMSALREVIAQSNALSSDPLYFLTTGGAAREIQFEKYSVHFETKQKLNIVLERAAEWAIVKESSKRAVSEGSALLAVNGTSTTLLPYVDTIRMLTGWQPPLTLEFARAPQKFGWLNKRSRGRHNTNLRNPAGFNIKNWKQRYFSLSESKLSYYISSEDQESLRDCVHLMGSVVSIVSSADSGGLNFCFRLVSGVAVVLMQATTLEEMLSWATTLYNAIAIANGGGYLLYEERKKQQQQQSDAAAAAAAAAAADTTTMMMDEQRRASSREAPAHNNNNHHQRAKEEEMAKQQLTREEAKKARLDAEDAVLRRKSSLGRMELLAKKKEEENQRETALELAELARAEAKRAAEALTEAYCAQHAARSPDDEEEGHNAAILEKKMASEKNNPKIFAKQLDLDRLTLLNNLEDDSEGDGRRQPPPIDEDEDEEVVLEEATSPHHHHHHPHHHMPSTSSLRRPPPPPPRHGLPASASSERMNDVAMMHTKLRPPRPLPPKPLAHPRVKNSNAPPDNNGYIDDIDEDCGVLLLLDSDDEDPDMVLSTTSSSRVKSAPRALLAHHHAGGGSASSQTTLIDDWTPPTEEELGAVFSVVKGAEGYVSPVQFIALLRAVGVSLHNLKLELDLFHEFDENNTGYLTKSHFVEGFSRYIAKHQKTPHDAEYIKEIIHGIRAYQAKGTVSL